LIHSCLQLEVVLQPPGRQKKLTALLPRKKLALNRQIIRKELTGKEETQNNLNLL
jgi:hypothetical protein